MNGKQIKLNILVTDKDKKNKSFELSCKPGDFSIYLYIIRCFQIKKKYSLILFRNKPLDEKISYEKLKCEKFETFQLYVFPEPSYKPIFVELIENKENFDQCYYALIKAKGNKAEALKIAQPNKKGIFFSLTDFVRQAEDYEDINCVYSQYISENQEKPLSPWQYLKFCKLQKDLYSDKKVKKFLEVYDTEFKYKKKNYEYYKFRLTDSELSIVNGLMNEYFQINLDYGDGDEDDEVNEIIQQKELVLNTFMASDKNKDLTRAALDCIVIKD